MANQLEADQVASTDDFDGNLSNNYEKPTAFF